MKGLIRIREMLPGDRAFVLDSWLESLELTHTWRRKDARVIAEDLLLTASFAVACAADAEDQIFAWACFELAPRPTLFYLYTKQVYRRMGIAKHILGHVFPEKRQIQVAFHSPNGSHFEDCVKDFEKVVSNQFYLTSRVLTCASNQSSRTR